MNATHGSSHQPGTDKHMAEMVFIPGGEYLMGTPDEAIDTIEQEQPYCRGWFEDETPQHIVDLPPYYIDKYPVTNAMFAEFVRDTNYTTVAEARGWSLAYTQDYWCQVPGINWRYPVSRNVSIDCRPDHPVVHIARHDAIAYAEWAGKRLPTEAEWELAARGYQFRRWPWGDTWDARFANTADYWAGTSVDDIATWKAWWSRRNAGVERLPDTTPVGLLGQESASPFGVYDMAGNVYEWTISIYTLYSSTHTYDDIYRFVAGKYHVIRGGSWMNFKYQVRCCERMAVVPDGYTNFSIGFRCARDA